MTLNSNERTKCEIWTRVMGYHRSVTDFNIGKKAEYAERTVFCEEKAMSNVASA
jgi:anaerobic ribonucleoside-triphosphate reductase